MNNSNFFKPNKLWKPLPPAKKAEQNPSFLDKYIQDEIKKLPLYIQRKIARENKS